MPSNQVIQVRLAQRVDAESIATVLYESFIEFRQLYSDGGFAATALSAEQIISRMDEGPVWLALMDNAIVGTVSVVPKGQALYVRGMAVLPATRGRHLGHLLLDHVESYAAAHSFNRLFLSTTPFLDRAIRLYEK